MIVDLNHSYTMCSMQTQIDQYQTAVGTPIRNNEYTGCQSDICSVNADISDQFLISLCI